MQRCQYLEKLYSGCNPPIARYILSILREYSVRRDMVQWQRRLFCPKRRFRTVFVSFSNRIVLCRFKRRLKEKRR